jgi:hypothetical protein
MRKIYVVLFEALKTKTELYLKIQFVPRSKHTPSLL